MLNTIIKFGANVTGKTLSMNNKNHLLSLQKDKFKWMVENIHCVIIIGDSRDGPGK